MKLFNVFAAAVLLGSSAIKLPVAKATEVDTKIHQLCIEAKDYAGCVRAMKGDTSSRVVNSQGADIAEGNKCTAGYAYIGGGNCQDVTCQYPSSPLGHDKLVAGLKDKNGKDVWKCKYDPWVYGAGNLRLTGAVTRATQDPNCPDGEPRLGYNSTCQKPPAGWESPSAKATREKREGPQCDFKLKAYKCSYNTYLDANPSMKQWAELNPDIANKERIRLQSVD